MLCELVRLVDELPVTVLVSESVSWSLKLTTVPEEVRVVVALPVLIAALEPRVTVSTAFWVSVSESDSLAVIVEVSVSVVTWESVAFPVLSLTLAQSWPVSVVVPVRVSVLQSVSWMVSLTPPPETRPLEPRVWVVVSVRVELDPAPGARLDLPYYPDCGNN